MKSPNESTIRSPYDERKIRIRITDVGYSTDNQQKFEKKQQKHAATLQTHTAHVHV